MKFKTPVKGIHIGPTCVDGSVYESPEIAAHAHIKGCQMLGWICARSKKDLAAFIIHEIAHLASNSGHDDRWRASVRKLGGRVPAAYKRRRRS